MSDSEPPLLEIANVRKEFTIRRGAMRRVAGAVKAVNDVSLDLERGLTFGLVGESGSGKTTLARMVLGLERPTSGHVRIRGVDVQTFTGARLKALRRELQVVFQDPYGALPPRMRVGRILEEPFRIHRRRPTGEGKQADAHELLELVGLPASHADRFPHQLSGGQRQRVVIARALALDPELLVCDEPVSALDVSVQAHILNLLQSLQDRLGLSYLFVSHDLGVVRHIADEIGVMYSGSLVERGPAQAVYAQPLHPYTRALLSAIPSVRRTAPRQIPQPAPASAPNPLVTPQGCVFRGRCPLATDRCAEETPALRTIVPARWAACHHAETLMTSKEKTS